LELSTTLSSREQKVATQSIDSTFVTMVGNVLYALILALCSLIIARLLGPSDYGAYSLALAVPLFLQLMVGFGVLPANTRYTAYSLSKGDITTAQRMTKNAILFLIISSISFTFVSFILAGSISSFFLHRPQLTSFVEVASISIIAQALFNFLTGAFIAWGIPIQDAIWNAIQATLKLALSVFLVLVGLGIAGALWGFDISFFLAGFFGIVTLYAMKLRKQAGADFHGGQSIAVGWSLKDFVNDLNTMVRYGVPSYIGNVVLAFSQQPVLVVILSLIASNTVIGYYSSATNITNALTMISGSLGPVFFTAFSKLDGMKSDTRTAFSYAVKYISYFIMPTVFFLIATSSLVIRLVYGNAYGPATYYLELLMLAYLPIAFGQGILGSFFNGLGKTRFTLFMNLVEAFATLLPAIILIIFFKLGVNGLLYSIIISNIVPTVFGLYIAVKYFQARADLPNLIKTLSVSVVCYAVLYLLSTFAFRVISGTLFSLLAFLLELIVFSGLYLTLMPLFRAISTEDINRLRVSSHGLKILTKVLHPILNYESLLIEKLFGLKSQQ
jgi:stage V sporulation protein B